jgi:hypothetical protein
LPRIRSESAPLALWQLRAVPSRLAEVDSSLPNFHYCSRHSQALRFPHYSPLAALAVAALWMAVPQTGASRPPAANFRLLHSALYSNSSEMKSPVGPQRVFALPPAVLLAPLAPFWKPRFGVGSPLSILQLASPPAAAVSTRSNPSSHFRPLSHFHPRALSRYPALPVHANLHAPECLRGRFAHRYPRCYS